MAFHNRNLLTRFELFDLKHSIVLRNEQLSTSQLQRSYCYWCFSVYNRAIPVCRPVSQIFKQKQPGETTFILKNGLDEIKRKFIRLAIRIQAKVKVNVTQKSKHIPSKH